MGKRQKHITINLTEDHYNALKILADNERRTITDTAYLLLIDEIEKKILNHVIIKSDPLTKI